jgi:hypothetical protein
MSDNPHELITALKSALISQRYSPVVVQACSPGSTRSEIMRRKLNRKGENPPTGRAPPHYGHLVISQARQERCSRR